MPDDTAESISTTSETESEEPPSLSPAPTPPHLHRERPSTPHSDYPPDIINLTDSPSPPQLPSRSDHVQLPSTRRTMSDNGSSPVLAIRPPIDRPPPLDPLVASSPPRNERWVSMNKNVLQDIFETTLKDHISEADVPRSRFVSRRRLSSPVFYRRESDVSDSEADLHIAVRRKVSAPCPPPMPPRSQVPASPDPLRGFQSTCPQNSLFPPHGGSRQLREHNGSSSSLFGARPGERGRFVVVPDDPAIELLREQSLLAVCGYVSESRYKAVSRALPAALTGQRWYPPALTHTHGPPFGFFHTAAVGLTRASDDMVIIGPRRVAARRGSVGNHQPTQKLRADCSNHHNLFGPHLTMTEEDLRKERDQNLAKTNLGYHSQIVMDEKRNTYTKSNKAYKIVDSELDVFRSDKSYTMDNRNSLRCENNCKKKPRQTKCKEKQHWFGISKAAIEGILDELVVSSISSDDSGSDSRSHTPHSEGRSGDSDVVVGSPKPTGAKVKQSVCDNKLENKTTSAQIKGSSLTSSIQKFTESKESPLSPGDCSQTVTPLSAANGTEHVQDNQSPPYSGSKSPRSGNNQISYQDPSVTVSSHGKSNAPSQHLPSTNCPLLLSNSTGDSKEPDKGVKSPSESLPSKGWVVLNKPLISSMMEEAFNRESSNLPESESSPKGRESSDDGELHIVDVESVPSPESQNNNNKQEKKSVDESLRSYAQKPIDGRATALLLGALCMEERVPSQQVQSRAHKRPHGMDQTSEPRNKAQCSDHENKGIDLRICRRKSTDERSSVGMKSMYEEVPHPADLHHLYDRRLTYQGMMTSPHLMAHAQSDHLRRNMSNLANTNNAREVICLDNVDSSNRESGVYKNSSVLGLSSDQDNRHHMERAINLATKQSAHLKPNASHSCPINYTKGDGKMSPDCCVVDMADISCEKSKGRPSDLSANPQQMSAMVAEAIKVGTCMPPPSAKSRAPAINKRSNNRNGNSKSRKEPRHGWVVISKDEVHTIMDSLTSQLILHCSPEDDKTCKDDKIVNKENVSAEKCQPAIADHSKEKQFSPSPSPSPKQSATFEMVSTQHFDNSESKTIVDNRSSESEKSSPTSEEFSGPSQDEEFRRTAIDALNAVYRHEDGLESVHLTESSQKDIVSLSSDSTDVNSRDSESPRLSANMAQEREQLAITTIIRDHPVRQIVDEVDVVTLEPKSHSAPTSPIDSHDPEQTFIPDDNAKKGFKWKSSILQRVRYDQPEDSMSSCSLSSSPASSPSATSSPVSRVRSASMDKSKRRSLSTNRNKTKRGNKKR